MGFPMHFVFCVLNYVPSTCQRSPAFQPERGVAILKTAVALLQDGLEVR